MAAPAAPLYATPIPLRPPPTPFQRAHLVLFNLTFASLAILLHTFQLLFLRFRPAQALAKEAFAAVLVLIVAVFGPTTLVVTADGSAPVEELLRRDRRGEVVGLRLERQAVWMANHQMYADWIYPWIAMSFAGVSSGLVIVLKASLEWAPLVGPAMQLFRFCFINNSTKPLSASNLARVAADAARRDEPYQCLLFPEGTLYSPLTRPKSKAFAEKEGIPDATHVLLPRALGLFFVLRTLRSTFPHLVLYDLTLGYAGVPSQGYAQDYYRLQTLFGLRVPPPRVHMHVRRVSVQDVPLEEKDVFERWLRKRWEEKDELMRGFGDKGRFDGEAVVGAPAEMRIRLRWVDGARLAAVVGALWAWWRVARWAWAWARG
ncbi:hypothetical protein JCM10449v2_002856 [Rhodotorula kratochvilovae]